MREIYKMLLDLYDNHRDEINEFGVRDFLNYGKYEAEEFDENRRWSRAATTIVRIPTNEEETEFRYFAVIWDQGLTEMQDNEYISVEEVQVKHETAIKTFEVKSRDFYFANGEIALTECSVNEVDC